jgi:hypothetical protein
MRLHQLSRSRRFVAAGLAGLVAICTLAVTATVAMATPPSDESSFVTMANRARAQAGLPPFELDAPLADTARSWSASMAQRNQLSHDPDLIPTVARIEPAWRSAAENVGVGADAQQVFDAFMGSSQHRANLLSSRFNRLGPGVVHSGGKVWVTLRFIEGPSLTATTASTPTGIRTVLTGDFDGDGSDDALTYGPGSEADELWFGMAGSRTMRQAAVTIKGQYQPVAGDFDGDGRTDVLWYAPGTATDSLWEWNGSSWTSTSTTINGTYTARAGDFDADGMDDILWYAPGSAPDHRWYGSASGAFASYQTSVAGSYIPLVGDFDGNGGDDVLWYGRGTASDSVWYSTRQRNAHRAVSISAGGAHSPFAGDFDGNGVDDIFFYTPGTAADVTWFNTRSAFASTRVSRSVGGSYVPAAGDFDRNGADDAMWFSPVGASGDPLWWGVAASTGYTAATVRGG